MSSLAPPPAASTGTRTTWAWWNAYHTLFAIFLGAYVAYILVILGRMTHASDEPIPRSLNAILLTALSLAALLAFVAAGNRHRRDRELQWQAAITGEITRLRRTQLAVAEGLRAVAAGLSRTNECTGERADEDPTVRLNHRPRATSGQAYASAAVVSTGRIDSLAERVEEMALTIGLAPGQRVADDELTTDIDPELRGYLKRVYDEETRRGHDPIN